MLKKIFLVMLVMSVNFAHGSYKESSLNNVVIINSVEDLPTPADLSDGLGTCYRLSPANYHLGTALTLAYPFASDGAYPAGFVVIDAGDASITYTGSGAMFRTNETSYWLALVIRHTTLVSGTGTNTCFSFTDTSNRHAFVGEQMQIIGFDDIGTFTNQYILNFRVISFLENGSGLKLDSVDEFTADSIAFLNSTGVIGESLLSLEGSSVSAVIGNCLFDPYVNEDCVNIDSASDFNVDFSGSIFLQTGTGLAFKSGSKTQKTPGTSARGCKGISDSNIAAEAEQTTSTTAITIPAIDAYVISDVGGWAVAYEERITIDANDGSFTYDGLESAIVSVNRDMHLDQTPASQVVSIREWCVTPTQIDVTFTNGTNLINETATSLSDDNTITFRDTTGTLPAELQEDIIYYVVSQATNSFQVSYTEGGAAITFTDDGTPTNNYRTTIKHGSEPSATLTAGTPQTLSLKSLSLMASGTESVVTVRNHGATNDVRVYTGGYLRIP